MENKYRELGFKFPCYVENDVGIKIYFGTMGGNDWAVRVPHELLKYKAKEFAFDQQDFIYYSLTESQAFDKAEFWTRIARERKIKS